MLDATTYKRIDSRTIAYIPGRDVLLMSCTTHTYIVNVRCANPGKISTNAICWTKRVSKENSVKVSVPFYKAYTSASWYR